MAKKRASKRSKLAGGKSVETIFHEDASRLNIPTAEYQSVMETEAQYDTRVAYARRNRDLDPQLMWRGKDEQDLSDLVVHAPPIYIQEKVHPKVLIDDLLKRSRDNADKNKKEHQLDLFSDFNGLPDSDAKTEFYQHEANWTNRMILGDSLQVMASLADREGLRGKVQCIYFDPPYGIKFNSNFQWSTTSRDVKDGKADHITREPEQVKAFRDTWRDGIHSYLTYLRDRLTVVRDLLTDSGSIFVQIGDENVHRVRAVMDEVFGDENFVTLITVWKTSSQTSSNLASTSDYVVWYARNISLVKYRGLNTRKDPSDPGSGADDYKFLWLGNDIRKPVADATDEEKRKFKIFGPSPTTSQSGSETTRVPITFNGREFLPGPGGWKTNATGFKRLIAADRIMSRTNSLRYVRFLDDYPVVPISNLWTDVRWGFNASEKRYVVETNPQVLIRCILMATDPGDLVLDPTCGSGTTATVAEQWGRRWITIDTSRVALALARARIMGARYPFYLLADSKEGRDKENQLRGLPANHQPLATSHSPSIRHGFVYERVPHITLKSIANNTEIDVIWDKFEGQLEPIRKELGVACGLWLDEKGKPRTPEEWEIPRDPDPKSPLSTSHKSLFTSFWDFRIKRQKEIDASIASKAEFEYLYDKPYEDKKKVRVAGPFTVESLSPHRSLIVGINDELIDPVKKVGSGQWLVDSEAQDFVQMILENLKTAGVQQAHKEDKIQFSSLKPWPGRYVCAEGVVEVDSEVVVDSDKSLVDRKEQKPAGRKSLTTNHQSPTTTRAAIFIGPEFGTVSKPDLVAAAREAGDAGFDVLIACAFNYDAHSSEFGKLGRVQVLKARMNADLHMADDLKNTGKGNLFVIFGEPDIEVASEEWIVDSSGIRIAPYEIVKLLSGVDSLAEINRLDREDLRGYAKLSLRREIWDYLTDAARDIFDTGKHRGMSSQKDIAGVSSIAWHSARLAGGVCDFFSALRKAGVHESSEFRILVDRLRRDKSHASRSNEIAEHQSLTSIHYPLPTLHYPLSTSHYTQVTIHGVDVFHPNTGEVRSDGADGIACWFIDSDYNEESFFVRQAYFLGANDPYKSLKTTLKAEIDADAWSTLNSDTSRPFPKPKSGRIAVKVINHLGDEVMKVFRVEN